MFTTFVGIVNIQLNLFWKGKDQILWELMAFEECWRMVCTYRNSFFTVSSLYLGKWKFLSLPLLPTSYFPIESWYNREQYQCLLKYHIFIIILLTSVSPFFLLDCRNYFYIFEIKTKDNKYWWGYREIWTLAHYRWECKMVI